jgi:hypothetical protein
MNDEVAAAFFSSPVRSGRARREGPRGGGVHRRVPYVRERTRGLYTRDEMTMIGIHLQAHQIFRLYLCIFRDHKLLYGHHNLLLFFDIYQR